MPKNLLIWPLIGSVYITQYIGVAFVISAAFAIFRQQGVALDKLALLNLAALPLAFKILYAPLIDRFKPRLQGQYRSWLLLAQLAMSALLAVAAALDVQQHFSLLLALLFVYVLATGFQDVSVDGLACKLFGAEQRRLASGIQICGNLLGNIIGGGLILIFYSQLQWAGSLLLLALLTLLSALLVGIYREPEDSQSTERATVGQFSELKDFIVNNRNWLLFMAIFPIGFSGGTSLLNALLVDAGWPLSEVGNAIKVYGSLVGVVSALMAMLLLRRLGRKRALWVITLLQGLGLLSLVPVTLGATDKLSVYLAISGYNLGFPAILVSLSTLFMDRVQGYANKATLYTLQFSTSALMGFIYSGLGLTLVKLAGYSSVVVAGAVITLGIGFGLMLVNLRQSKLSRATLGDGL